MTRRNFARCLSIMCAAMIGKIENVDGSIGSKVSIDRNRHIRNRRLFNFAAGAIMLSESERNHLHDCEQCQIMASLLIRSIARFPQLEFRHNHS